MLLIQHFKECQQLNVNAINVGILKIEVISEKKVYLATWNKTKLHGKGGLYENMPL